VPANARLHPREVEFIAEMRTSVFPAQALSNAVALPEAEQGLAPAGLDTIRAKLPKKGTLPHR
jgi:hypothetical protein